MNDVSDTSPLGRGIGLALGDATGPSHRRTIDGDAGTLLGFAAHRRLPRMSIAITAHQELGVAGIVAAGSV